MFKATLYPNRISVRYAKPSKSVHDVWAARLVGSGREQSNQNLKIKKQNFTLSYQTQKKIKDSIAYLQQCSPARTVVLQKKTIYNFRTSFITLTLPSKQIHSDLEIKKCLNHFLVQMRSRFSLKNYVWKAELQANQNIHFHLIVDIPVPYWAVRYYWNQSIEVLGYVSRYQNEWSGLSLAEYAEKRGIEVAKAVSGFIKGRDTQWRSPGTEQVKAVTSDKMLGWYLAKYIVKPANSAGAGDAEDIQRVLDFGRVWGRSQSLSKIVFFTHWDWDSLRSFLGKSLDTMLKKVSDWNTTFYISKFTSKKLLKWLRLKMLELGYTFRYPFPVFPNELKNIGKQYISQNF